MYWTSQSLPHSPPHIDTLRSAPVRPVSWWERKWTHLGSRHLHLWEGHHLLSTDRWGLCPELVLSEKNSDGPSLSILVGGFFLLKAVPWLKEKLINSSLQKHAFYVLYNTSQGQSIDNLIETCMHIAIAATKPTNMPYKSKDWHKCKHMHSHMYACSNEMT